MATPLATAAPVTGGVADQTDGVTVRVTVTGLRSDRGDLIACMTPLAAQFPSCDGQRTFRLVVPAQPSIAIEFPGVPEGRYAIALLHDENANGKADKAMAMIPREGFGFSRDAPVRMGPPRFEQAAFLVGAQAPARQAIRMRYFFR